MIVASSVLCSQVLSSVYGPREVAGAYVDVVLQFSVRRSDFQAVLVVCLWLASVVLYGPVHRVKSA